MAASRIHGATILLGFLWQSQWLMERGLEEPVLELLKDRTNGVPYVFDGSSFFLYSRGY